MPRYGVHFTFTSDRPSVRFACHSNGVFCMGVELGR